MTKQELYIKLQNYLELFSNYCIENKIDVKGIKIDHICYKCESNIEYENIRKFFEFEDKFVYQSIISKRRIAYIGFETPSKSLFGDVNYLELSDQKPDNSQKSECDRIEPIIDSITYAELLNRFSINDLKIQENIKPHHSTHDIKFPNGVKIKMNHEPLVNKIYRDELILN
jgi:predicted metalloenzyme YecM